MSFTNIEYLFQLTTPVADRAVSTTGRGGDDRPPFGDHLSVASATTRDETVSAASPSARDYDGPPEAYRQRAGSVSDNAGPENPEPRPTDSASGATADSSADNDPETDVPDESAGANESAVDANGDASVSDGNDGASGDVGNSDALNENEGGADAVATAAVSAAGVIPTKAAIVEAATAENVADSEAANDTADGSLSIEPSRSGRRAVNLSVARDVGEGAAAAASSAVTPLDADEAASVSPQSKTKKQSGTADQAASEETDGLNRARGARAGRARAAVLGDAEATNQVAAKQNATGQSKSSDAASSESARDKDADEPRRGRNAKANSLSTPRAEAAQIASKAAAAALASGASKPSDGASSTGEAAQDGAQAIKAPVKGEALAAVTGRLQPAGVAMRRAARADGNGDMPRVDPVRFVGRVAKAFQTARERGGTLQLRLSPPELGSLRLELTVKDGVMTAALETENTSARRVLLDHLPALRDRLAEQNIRVERFDVDVRRDGSEGQPDPRAFHDHGQSQQGQPEPRRRAAVPPQAAESARPAGPNNSQPTNNDGINLVA